MEAGGLMMAEAAWAEFDFPSHAEESESEAMARLFGDFPSYGEEGHHELLPWSDQAASNAFTDTIAVPPAYEGYHYCLSSSSNEADLGFVQDHGGAAEFLSNHPLGFFGNAEDLSDPSMSVVDSVSAGNKRKHSAGDHNGQPRGRKSARKGETRRAKRAKQGAADEDAIAGGGNPTSCCTSDSDSNASQEESADADDARQRGKARAGRGATTTEPQSIYARKRRERINERLKILQGLVPNGTKVDISTMLEEAVHYVKFLQLQIRLLSSDDMWMYAPIAYNGMNIGIDLSMLR